MLVSCVEDLDPADGKTETGGNNEFDGARGSAVG